MMNNQDKYEIRATYDDQNIAVYTTFSSSIADVAIKKNF